jgi:hypothetical protein
MNIQMIYLTGSIFRTLIDLVQETDLFYDGTSKDGMTRRYYKTKWLVK